MKLEEYENHNLIFESVWRTIGLTLLSGVFVLLALSTDFKEHSRFMFLGSLILFGSGFVIGLTKLLNPRNLFLAPNSARSKEYQTLYFERSKGQTGIFEYHENGFSVKRNVEEEIYNWDQIQTIIAYKQDLLTYDNICSDIHFDNGHLICIDEETEGWFQFANRCRQNLEGIDEGWEFSVALPAFSTNLTIVYDKLNRSPKEIKEAFYSDEKSL